MDMTYDVIVVVGGNVGLCAALSARDEGAEVLLIERSPADIRGGRSVQLRKFPPMIEQIFECGGLPDFARERHMREAALAGRGRG